MDHNAIEELLGAYALNAVDPHEAAMVEIHVAACMQCAEELAQHREVASLLPAGAEFAPSTLWQTISEGIGGTETVSGPAAPLAPVVPLRRRRWASAVAIAAVFALVAGTAVVQSIRVGDVTTELSAERARVAELTEALDRPVLDTAVSKALVDPLARQVVLGSQVSGSNAIIVLMPDGTGYLAEHSLQPLSVDRTYQLWAIIDGRVISAGVLGPNPGVVPFHIDPDGFQGFAITEEVIGGVVASENDPIVAWLAA